MNAVSLKSKKAATLFNFLTDQGFRPSTSDTEDITFKREGKNYLILLMDDDPIYFRLIFPNFWKFTPDERVRALEAASHCNNSVKVAKTQLTDDGNVWASVELFLPDLSDLTVVLERCLLGLDLAANNFRHSMANSANVKK